MIVEIV